jgi:hypothetical protein
MLAITKYKYQPAGKRNPGQDASKETSGYYTATRMCHGARVLESVLMMIILFNLQVG